MSTQRPSGGPRRRRIAGERRPLPRPDQPAETTRTDVPPPAPHEPQQPTPATGEQVAGPGVERHTGWWGSRASLAVLVAALAVLLTLGALAAVGLLGVDGFRELREAEAAEQAATTAPATAERAAAAILAYDHQTLDADQDAATRFMTDSFAEQYTETFEKVVKPTAEESRATVTATVQGTATVRASAERARVLLFVDQTTVSRANEGPQVALNRVEMVLVRQGGSWLVDDITSY